jgi:O-glycosyl hydrolase
MLKIDYSITSNYHPRILLSILLTMALFVNKGYSQAEVEPWGNITGIRKQGQLFEFESSLKVKYTNGHITSTAKERQQPHYKRNGDEQIITSNIDSLFFKETVKDLSTGKIKVSLSLAAHKDIDISGVYFCITLPADVYTDSRFRLFGTKNDSLKSFTSSINSNCLDINASGIDVNSKSRQLKVLFDGQGIVSIKRETSNGENNLQFSVALNKGSLHKGDTMQKAFTIMVSDDIDKTPVNLVVNTSQKGREFDGLGGNFRLQNPKFDPQVIDYCLKNLRVAWGRVEMPWRFWQPNKDIDPIATADSGKLHPAVKKAMEMAHRLDSMGTPIILSAWFPPSWAAEGKVNFRPVNGIWGNPLNKDNMDAIYKSIADYIQYLKNKYGVEIKLFSFNESDLGINIRITAQEHDDFIKGCGAYFAAHGLKTKMLLGDNSDATTYKFIYPAMGDPDARQYIGAISFHSWRGWDTEILQKWADAATKLNLPLIVGEGSIDAAAWNYPDIFQEQTYALKEINLYIRLLAICQPVSILQWQLTSDYSPLIGGGIFGNNEPLHPGQRFWNLKQLSITPKGLFAMAITCDRPNITTAALGNNNKGIYAVHLVNNGTTRNVTLTGLPATVKLLHIYTTSKEQDMKENKPINVTNGCAKFKLPATSYVTLISE